MKKKIGIALSLMMSLSIVNADLNIVNAENDNQEITEYSNSIIDSGKCGDNATWQLTNDGTLTISGSGNVDDFNPLTQPWYIYSSSIRIVNIEQGITSIGTESFRDCTYLTNITIPNSLTSIGYDAFSMCSSLTNITIPNSVTSIGAFAFRNCISLKSITIPNNVAIIGPAVFSGCDLLTEINVDGENVNYCSIDGVLYNKQKTILLACPGKKSINVPNSITSIENGAFYGCKSLINITIPDSVTSIADFAFFGCHNLTNITIPNNVTSINNYTFGDCINLKNIILPNGVTTIVNGAFFNCQNLKNITLSNDVTSIGEYAFDGCKNLTLSVYKGSYGEKYVQKYNLKYSIIGQTVLPTSVKLNATSKTIQKGKTYTLVATITPSNATNKKVTYETSNNSVATVTTNGTVKAVNGGTAVITVKTSNKKTATCKVTVPYTVKYNLNGGTNNKSNPTSYYGKRITLQNPTRKGYSFVGWYSDSKYKTKVTSFSSGNKVLYAKWNKVTVSKAKTPTLTNIATRKLKVSYGATSGVKGYQIQYATNSKFTGSKTKTTSSRSYTITPLTKGKRYYVRVRGYKIDSTGNKVYGPWSTVKSIKISK